MMHFVSNLDTHPGYNLTPTEYLETSIGGCLNTHIKELSIIKTSFKVSLSCNRILIILDATCSNEIKQIIFKACTKCYILKILNLDWKIIHETRTVEKN